MINRDNLFSIPISNLKDWKFDQKVSHVFRDMIERSIPGYSNIISLTSMLASRFAKTGTQIYDLGCSVGTATFAIGRTINHSGCSIFAVDNSSFMIDFCHKYMTIESIFFDTPIFFIKNDICSIPMLL